MLSGLDLRHNLYDMSDGFIESKVIQIWKDRETDAILLPMAKRLQRRNKGNVL